MNLTAPPASPPPLGRIVLIAIFLIALLARLAVVWQSSSLDYHRYLVLDAATYHRIAIEGDPRGPFWQPPLYPWFLRGIYALAGEPDPRAARVVQSLGGALVAVLVSICVSRLAARRWAIGAGLGTALYGPLIAYDTELLPASLAALLSTLLLTLLTAPPTSSPRWMRWRLPLAGLLLGALGLLLPAFAFAGALLLIWLWRLEGFRRALLVATLAVVVIAPVTIRNWQREPDLVAISYNGGVNLWIGNNPDYPRTVAIRPGIEWGHLVEQPRCAGGARTSAQESAWFSKQVRRFAREHPVDFVTQLARKLAASVSIYEIGRNRDDYDAREESLLMRLLLQRWGWPFLLLLPLTTAGICASLRHRALSWPALCLTLGVLLAAVLFFPSARYRIPALPAMIILAAAGLPRVSKRDGLVAAGALVLGLIPAGIPPIPPAETLYAIGIDRDQAGDSQAASSFYERALTLAPDNADLHLALGLALSKLGREDEGRAHLERAVVLQPNADVAWQGLGLYWMRHRDWDRARAAFERGVAADRCNQRLRASFAMALIDQGYLNEARRQLDEARRLYPKPDGRVAEAERRLDAIMPRK